MILHVNIVMIYFTIHSGYKTWVPNAHMADLFLVVAQAPVDALGEDEGTFSRYPNIIKRNSFNH